MVLGLVKMKAYVIKTWREVMKDIGGFDYIPIGKISVSAIYLPGKLLIGYEQSSPPELILETHAPFLGVQEIIDGKRKGFVKKFEMDDERRSSLNRLIDNVNNIPNKGLFLSYKRNRHYYKICKNIEEMINEIKIS